MHGGESAHHRVIPHLNVAAQCAVVRENDAITHGAIVADMTVSEKVSAIADPRLAFARRAAMSRYEFAKCVFVADFQISRFTPVF